MLDLWQQTRNEIRRQHGDLPHAGHLDRLSQRSWNGHRLELATSDEMAALLVEKNLLDVVTRVASEVAGSDCAIAIVHEPTASQPADPVTRDRGQLALFGGNDPAPTARPRRPQSAPAGPAAVAFDLASAIVRCGLHRDFDFDRFVVGSSNEFAWRACQSVAEAPGAAYNPLFLYGASGLGKTHLMNAIGIAALRARPETRVRYLSAETFVNEMLDALRTQRMDEFRQRNRADVDLLLIDDIQFLAGKERTQEEFFHTFNHLHQAGRQIVVTSDRVPQELRPLEDRLRSRLTQGLIADIQPPDLETRVVILQRRAAEKQFAVPADVIHFIAQNIRSNVRTLHGALNRIGSWAQVHRRPITLQTAEEQLSLIARESEIQVNPESVIRWTSEVFATPVREMKGRKRIASIATPRNVAMYLCRRHTGASYPELGRLFGGRDHTTVMSSCRTVEERLERDPELRRRIEAIERRIQTEV